MYTKLQQNVTKVAKIILAQVLILAIIASVSVLLSTNALATYVGDRRISSATAVVIDYETGKIIFDHNAEVQRVPASMTKLLAVAVVLDAIEDGRISFDTRVYTSYNISNFSMNRRYSNVPMPVGSSYSVRHLIDAVMLRSAGAATVALAELLYGTEATFINRMNAKVIEYGLVGDFRDSWGISADTRISAYYMAQLARAIVKEHPIILEIASRTTMSHNNIAMNNTNTLLGNYDGLDGLKTGFTNAAGWCFVGTAMRDGRRIIAVTMGSSDRDVRFTDSTILLNYGFTNFNRAFAGHFRSEVENADNGVRFGSALVPISLYNDIEHRELFSFYELAEILNEG